MDGTGRAAVIECNADQVAVCYADEKKQFVSAVNAFMLDGMETYRVKGIDDWNAEERYQTIDKAFGQERTKEPIAFARDVLSGKYGFICQYDRKSGKDTVWSVIYDVGNQKIYRCEGNPSRKKYVEDNRLVF